MLTLPNEILEKDVAFVPSSRLGDDLSGSVGLQTFEKLLWLVGQHSPQSIQIAKNGEHVPVARINGADCLRLCREHVRSGYSIALNHAERWDVDIARIIRSLGAVFGCTTSASLFFAPPGGATFAAHFDAIDVIAVQLEGSKRWTIGARETDLPLVNTTLPIDFDVEWAHTYDLTQGQVLYVPRGKIHEVRAIEESHSLHVSIGLVSRCHADVMKRAIDNSKLQNTDLRRSRLSNSTLHASTLYDLTDVSQPSLNAYSLGKSAQGLYAADLAALDQLPYQEGSSIMNGKGEMNSTFVRTDACEVSREHVGDGSVALGFPGLAKGRINLDEPFLLFPSAAITALEAIRDAEAPFGVADIPGPLSDESKLVILNRLVLEGLLQVRQC